MRYSRLEQRLIGRAGAMPIAPVSWLTYPAQERQFVKESFEINALNQIDLSRVRVE